MKAVLPKSSAGRTGFSLIEILVATAILLIIVMLMSMVFQQSSGAYQSGTTRVNAQKVLRNIMGVISRDMALAVDSRYYPGLKNDFTPSSVGFVALTGTPKAASESDDGKEKRAPQWIEFVYAGRKVTRVLTELEWDGKEWVKGDNTQSILNPDYDLLDFSFIWSTTGAGSLPFRLDVYAKLETSGQFSFISGRSAGKDRQFGTSDDVNVGGND